MHRDAFTVLGYEESLDWFRRCISEKFEVKDQRIKIETTRGLGYCVVDG